ncbi:hypothetical protein BC829DRAFT_66693 [Chytridium lagenaria]|nr:hypothetical protein BC829DRAFT_66693 [Chytridium lagenaria]
MISMVFVKVQGEPSEPTSLISFNHIVISKAIYSLIDPHIQAQLHKAAYEAYRSLLTPSNEAIMLPKIISHLNRFPQATLNDKIFFSEKCFKKFCALHMVPESVQMGQSFIALLKQKDDWPSERVRQLTMGMVYGELASLHAFEFWPKTIQNATESLSLLCGYHHPTTAYKLMSMCLKTFFKTLKAVKLFFNDGFKVESRGMGPTEVLETQAIRARMRVFTVMSNYFLQANMVRLFFNATPHHSFQLFICFIFCFFFFPENKKK